jgi:hypothetical protein
MQMPLVSKFLCVNNMSAILLCTFTAGQEEPLWYMPYFVTQHHSSVRMFQSQNVDTIVPSWGGKWEQTAP